MQAICFPSSKRPVNSKLTSGEYSLVAFCLFDLYQISNLRKSLIILSFIACKEHSRILEDCAVNHLDICNKQRLTLSIYLSVKSMTYHRIFVANIYYFCDNMQQDLCLKVLNYKY